MVIPKQQPQCRTTVCCLGITILNLYCGLAVGSQTWWPNHRLRLLSCTFMKYPIIKMNILWKWLRPTYITHLTEGLQKLLRFQSMPCSEYVLNLTKTPRVIHSDWDLEPMSHLVTELWARWNAFHSSWRSVESRLCRWNSDHVQSHIVTLGSWRNLCWLLQTQYKSLVPTSHDTALWE